MEERLLVEELLQRGLLWPLNNLPSTGNGRRRDNVYVLIRVGTELVTPIILSKQRSKCMK